MAIHIKDLTVGTYRGLKELSLSGFNHVNIFTGDNNVGKTSVLELLQSAAGIKSTVSFIRMILNHASQSIFTDVSGIFPVGAASYQVEYSYTESNGEKHNVVIERKLSDIQLPEKEFLRRQGIIRTGRSKVTEEKIINTKQMDIYIYEGNEKISFSVLKGQSVLKAETNEGGRISVVFVRPFDHTSRRLDIDELLKNNKLHDELNGILRDFDSSILDLSKFENEYLVRTTTCDELIPLSYFGDGMKKVVRILSGVLQAQNGILLLDEFETAIHTSAMDSFYSWILNTARTYNVQVFITSHSDEAITKLLNLSEFESGINLYTLYKKEGKTVGRKVTCAEALKLKRAGLELR